MSGLDSELAAAIQREGPLSVARFMSLALHHPTSGYYSGRDPLGPEGDFVTAPELSQAFGEVVGAWLAQAWLDLGRPAPFRLVELGPGRGTLLADALRATRAVDGFHDVLRLHLVETSARLRAAQAARLAGFDPSWHSGLGEVPSGPLLLIANEFFDALPVHQLVATARGWVERCVDLDPEGRLAFGLAECPSPLGADLPDAPPGTIMEVSRARTELAREIGRRIADDGGVALVIDYGAWAEGPTGDTLQATRRHAPCDPLDAPGTADLTTHVDFRALAAAAAAGGASVYGPVPQGTFLAALGIHLRTAKLVERATPDQHRALRAALFRLTDASAMGELFKVLVLAGPVAPAPPAFHQPTLRPC
ncbi:MAG TPA: SAM-dependent methyltransferase [Geminicoccaceae bacterium]|nr:SAM-dependent methyltransferase [Geminicoccaceae bacterium]